MTLDSDGLDWSREVATRAAAALGAEAGLPTMSWTVTPLGVPWGQLVGEPVEVVQWLHGWFRVLHNSADMRSHGETAIAERRAEAGLVEVAVYGFPGRLAQSVMISGWLPTPMLSPALLDAAGTT